MKDISDLIREHVIRRRKLDQEMMELLMRTALRFTPESKWDHLEMILPNYERDGLNAPPSSVACSWPGKVKNHPLSVAENRREITNMGIFGSDE